MVVSAGDGVFGTKGNVGEEEEGEVVAVVVKEERRDCGG